MKIQTGTLHVRRNIMIEAAPSRVWREFESEERVTSWFGLGHKLHKFEPKVGGLVKLSVDIDGEQRYFGGHVLVFEKCSQLTFENQWSPPLSWPVPTFCTFSLTPLYDGTLVEFFHHGFERLGAEAADALQGYEQGWDINHLKELRNRIDT